MTEASSRFHCVVLAPKQDAGAIPLPEGHGGLVVDCWYPRGFGDRSNGPVILLDDEIVFGGWVRALVMVPPGSYSLQASKSYLYSCTRVAVTAGELVYLDYAKSATLQQYSKRNPTPAGHFVLPGTLPAGSPLTFLQACLTSWRSMQAWVIITFLALRQPPIQLHIARASFYALKIAFVSYAVLLALLFVSRRGYWRRRHWRLIRARAGATRAAIAAASRYPSGARFLGDRPPRKSPVPPPGQAAIRLHANWSRGWITEEASERPAYRDLPRQYHRGLTVQINGQDVPADWTTSWFPVPAGRARITVTSPMPAELELDVPLGRTADAYYEANLAEDAKNFPAIIPRMSAARLTATRLRRAVVKDLKSDEEMNRRIQQDHLDSYRYAIPVKNRPPLRPPESDPAPARAHRSDGLP